MAEASIPVDLFSPGQVFACLGFLEAAEVLTGKAEGGFDWSAGTGATYRLRTADGSNPFETVLEFLAATEPKQWAPVGHANSPSSEDRSAANDQPEEEDGAEDIPASAPDLSRTFPAKTGDRMALPIRFGGGNRPVVELGHWVDGSSRENFKLYAGNRSAGRIAWTMLRGTRKKPTGKQTKNGQPGDLKSMGLRQLWEADRTRLINEPFDVLTPMGGSFNFDPRGAWTAIDAGYSPNEHKHAVEASPVVEFLAAWGLEHARPADLGGRQVRYAAWGAALPPILARAALSGALPTIPQRRFRFMLDLSGKNKVVTFAQEELPA